MTSSFVNDFFVFEFLWLKFWVDNKVMWMALCTIEYHFQKNKKLLLNQHQDGIHNDDGFLFMLVSCVGI